MDDKGLDSGGDHTTLLTAQALALDKYVELFGGREKGKVGFDYRRYGIVKNSPLNIVEWASK